MAEREIGKLLALYPQYADDGAAAAFGALFAETGVLRAGPEPVQGPVAIAEWLRGTLKRGKMRHLITNVYINVTSPLHATGSSDMLLLGQNKDAPGWRILLAPRYTDKYVNTVAGWKFAERVLDPRA